MYINSYRKFRKIVKDIFLPCPVCGNELTVSYINVTKNEGTNDRLLKCDTPNCICHESAECNVFYRVNINEVANLQMAHSQMIELANYRRNQDKAAIHNKIREYMNMWLARMTTKEVIDFKRMLAITK